MEIIKDIPAKIGIIHQVERVTINLSDKKAYVEIHPVGGIHQIVEIDILQLFIDYTITTTQKNTIKTFFKYIIAKAMDVGEDTITEEIFSET